MSEPSLHPSEWTLEQYAESELAPDEMAATAAHIASCGRCAAEIDVLQAFFAELGELPRFAPGPEFGDAVMARVQIAAPPRLEVWLQRWLPQTGKAWAVFFGLLTAPAVPVVALVAWLLAQPMVSADSLVNFGVEQGRETFGSVALGAIEWALGTGAVGWGRQSLAVVSGLPLEFVAAAALVFAVGIPLSAWSLVRLVRSPTRDMVHAH